jgi:hypothetical protein
MSAPRRDSGRSGACYAPGDLSPVGGIGVWIRPTTNSPMEGRSGREATDRPGVSHLGLDNSPLDLNRRI